MTDSGNDVPEDDSMTSGVNDDASMGDVAANSSADSADSADSAASTDSAASAGSPNMSAAQEAEVRSLLGSLETPKMPAAVHDRLIAALDAEPNPFTSAPVVSLASHRRSKSGWLVAGAGVAAAGVLGLILGPSLLSGEGGTSPAIPTAAVVPMTTSGTVYEKQGLVTQISSALPTWKRAALDSAANDMVELPATDAGDPPVAVPAASPSASVTAEATPGESPVTVNKQVLEQINDCVRVMDTRTPIHVDIASYRNTPSQPAEPVAVFALDGDNEDIEVYVVSVKCTPADPGMVREHVTVKP